MPKRKEIVVILILAVVVLLFLFVGNGFFSLFEDGSVSEEKIKENETEEIEITVAGGAMREDLEREAAKMYMENNPGVKVNVLDTPELTDNRRGLYMQILEDKSPEIDVYMIDVVWPGDLAKHFVDFYEYADDGIADQHFQSIIENNTVDGRLVGIPWFTDAGLLYYREDLLRRYGFDVPQTWDELEKAARVIKESQERSGNENITGFVWQGDAYEGLTCNALEWVASHGGGQIVEPDGTITINNSNAIAAIERAASWVGDISPRNITSMTEEPAREIFQEGNAVFMRNWPYAYASAQADDSPIKGNVGVAPLPAGPEGEAAGTLGGWQLAVSRYSEDVETAVDVALFLASYDEQKRRAIEASLNPTIKDLYEDDEVLEAVPFFSDLYDVFINAVPRPATITSPRYNEVSREFYTGVYNVLTGEEEASDVVAFLETEYLDLGVGEVKRADGEEKYFYYTVKPGDTIYKIANNHNTTVQKIIELNDINNSSLIHPGDEFKLIK